MQTTTPTTTAACLRCGTDRPGEIKGRPRPRRRVGAGMTPERLADIRERATAATEGPWRSHDFGHAGEEEPSSIVVHTGKFDHSDLLTYDTETAVAWMPRWDRQESDNATFIAHARTDVPDLLAEVKRLTAENARLRERVDYCNDPSTWPTTLPGSPA